MSKPPYFLDITSDVCPITFVKTKLLIERMEMGEIAIVLLPDGEPLLNVPRSVREQGHEILALGPDPENPETHVMQIRKSGD